LYDITEVREITRRPHSRQVADQLIVTPSAKYSCSIPERFSNGSTAMIERRVSRRPDRRSEQATTQHQNTAPAGRRTQ